MKEAVLIFPHQLFEVHPCLKRDREIYIIEEFLFFRQYKFHKQKLVHHRSSMKFYQNFLNSKGFVVNYIESINELSDIRKLIPDLRKKRIEKIHFVDVADNWLEKRIKQTAEKSGIKIQEYPSPAFLNSKDELKEYFSGKKKYLQTDFYIKQRKKFGILLNKDGSPLGGKWSFDTENRLKYPPTKKPPKVNFPSMYKYYEEAVKYVNKNFSDHYSEINNIFIYPCTFEESKIWFREFLETRLFEFGKYEDAIVYEEHILHHSVLSPLLNIGLITPNYIINETLDFYKKHQVPLNSVEGFIRQIIGWREFVRAVYEFSGTFQRTKNFWGFKKKIPECFWKGTTGIEPIDITIKKVLQTGYCHHIERLMVLGSFMLLCEFDPNEVYRWFMELFIDAYDWVMVPNVYGMSQFADGGLMSTKPYFSGSNYLMKMSNYNKGDWQLILDGLFWRFINKHRKFFLSNPRLGMLIKTFDKMSEERKNSLLNSADSFLRTI